ncbi:MAG: tyrosine-type recombinase/integrase [Bacillota bacterium]
MLTKMEQFLSEQDKSSNTIKSYIRHISGYLNWFEQSFGTDFKQLYRENIKEFISYLKNVKKDSSSTINAKISALIKFNEYLVDYRVQDTYVISKKDNIKVQQKFASLSTLEKEDVDKFRQYLLEYRSSNRDYALVTLLAYSGLRISEAISIKFESLNLVSRELLVTDGKGSKSRTVFLNDKSIDALKLWIKERKKVGRDSNHLFISNRGKPVDRTLINKLFNAYTTKTGVKITPHDLRHFYCSHAIKVGMSIHEVANQAGHSNIHTTLIYTNPSRKEIMEKINNL